MIGRTAAKWCAGLALAVGLTAILGGCATYAGGRFDGVGRAVAASKGPALGKTILVVSGAHWVREFDVGATDAKSTHYPRVWDVSAGIVKQVPDTVVLNEADHPAVWSDDLSDQAAAALGQQKGADTVCMLSVGDYEGRLTITVPPAWWLTTRVSYTLRVVDAKTREVTYHSVRSATRDGLFNIAGPDSLAEDLKDLLRADLAVKK